VKCARAMLSFVAAAYSAVFPHYLIYGTILGGGNREKEGNNVKRVF